MCITLLTLNGRLNGRSVRGQVVGQNVFVSKVKHKSSARRNCASRSAQIVRPLLSICVLKDPSPRLPHDWALPD